MKKAIINLLFLSILFVSIGNAQELKVTYKQTKNLGVEQISYYNLFVTKGFSYYQEVEQSKLDEITSVEDEETDMGSTNRTRTTVIGRKDLTPQFVYASGDSKSIFFYENFADRLLFVEDNYQLDWKTTNETRKIENFNCAKAVATFRGRNYTAWYTMDIATKYGPWKFNSLPGLILEISDSENKFVIQAIKVEQKTEGFELDPILNNKDEALTIDEYINRRNSILDEEFAKLASKLPKGISPPKRDKNCNSCGNDVEIFE